MIPGLTSKLNEHTIRPTPTIQATADLVWLVGAGDKVKNITPRYAGFSGMLIVIPSNTDAVLAPGGNINVVANLTLPAGKPAFLIWSKITRKWYI